MTTALSLSAADRLVVAPRFCGPPGTGNGGYVAGWLAARAGTPGAVEVTLRHPAPLAVPLALARAESAPAAVALVDPAGTCVAEARPTPADPDDAPPALPPASAIEAAPVLHAAHPFPECFVCGPARAPGDGLRILAAAVPGARVAAACWRPGADLAGRGGYVDPAFVWAALDCPGYFGAMLGRPLVPLLLGRMTALITGPVRAGDRLRVLGWLLGRDGRRHATATALVDERNAVVARSRQVWIAPRSA